MNFIGHYAVSPYQEEPMIVFGSLLPDLYRGFSKDYNKSISPKLPENHQIDIGIKFHFETDTIFHNHHFFVKKNKELTLAIQEKNLAKKHTYIIAHVLFELLLDNFLIRENSGISSKFYDVLEDLDERILLQNLSLCFDNAQANKIFCIFKSFKNNKYAQHLKDAMGISQSLQHILGNKFNVEFDSNIWAPFIDQHIEMYNHSFEEFITNLKLKLYNA